MDTRLARQAWVLLAAPLALGGTPVDVVHGHCGEDIAVLPLARLAALLPAGHSRACQRAV